MALDPFINGNQKQYIKNYQQAMNLSPSALMATKNPRFLIAEYIVDSRLLPQIETALQIVSEIYVTSDSANIKVSKWLCFLVLLIETVHLLLSCEMYQSCLVWV